MRLTDRVVRGLPAPPQGNRVSYDGALGGFGIRTTAAGSKSFVLNYRRRSDGVERRYTIGSWPAWSVASAREEAARLKRLIDSGGDPVGEHQAERTAPTVADLSARFLEEHVSKLRRHTRRDYESMLRNDILPALARMKVSAVEFEHIERLHAKITKRGAAVRANRMLQVASRMFTLAVKWKLRPDNPAKGIERNREHLRKRYLKPDELTQLTKALAEDSNQQAADVFRLLLLTGARKNEVLSATWEQFDFAAGVWVKPHTMTKQKAEHHIPLSAPGATIAESAARAQRRLAVGFPRPPRPPPWRSQILLGTYLQGRQNRRVASTRSQAQPCQLPRECWVLAAGHCSAAWPPTRRNFGSIRSPTR